MDEPFPLSCAFLRRAPASCPLTASHELEATLRARYQEGRDVWPQVPLEAERFAGHLGAQLDDKGAPERALSSGHVTDLYLACACLQGAPTALSAFDRDFLGKVPGMLRRIDASPSFADEVQQVLRERLLVASPDGAPKLASFTGQGSLLGWLRIVATRTAQNLRRNRDEAPHQSVGSLAARAMPVAPSPEMAYLKARYQREFKEVLRAAFAVLPRDQRDLLRLRFLDELPGDRIADRLGISRRTVVRRLSEAREALLHETTRRLQERLRLSESEYESLIGLVRSDLELSMSMFLEGT